MTVSPSSSHKTALDYLRGGIGILSKKFHLDPDSVISIVFHGSSRLDCRIESEPGSDRPPAAFSLFVGHRRIVAVMFVADMSGGYEGALVSWQLQIGTVPELAAGQLLVAFGTLGVAFIALRKWSRNFTA